MNRFSGFTLEGVGRAGQERTRILSIRITVRVKPGASRSKVGGSYGDPAELIVAVNAPAIDGRATTAVQRALADTFDLPLYAITLISGATNRSKLFEISGDDKAISSKLAQLLLPKQAD